MREKHIENIEALKYKLWFYKSILYKRVKFTTNSKDEDIISIVNALNIKNRKKRIEYIFDYCCNRIDEYNKGKNICQFKGNKCINQQVPNCKYVNGCCRLCVHQSSTGCKTSNLTCKLFYCASVTKNYEVIKMKDLKILNLLSLRQRLILSNDFFSTRKQFITDLYIGSIVIYALRMAIREVTNLYKLKNLKGDRNGI